VSKRPEILALGLAAFALTTACGAREEADGRAFAYRCEVLLDDSLLMGCGTALH
jgi:hypothetical protein